MREFCDPETFRIILGTGGEDLQSWLLKDLLPLSFGPENLASGREPGEKKEKEVPGA